MVKKNTDVRQWNIFASPRATLLLARGFNSTKQKLLEEFEAMGGIMMDHSINRVDFAMDFRTQGFELHLNQFVAHAHTKIGPHWGRQAAPSDGNQPAAILRGRRLESVTIGKQPGRQVIVYDNRREAIERKKRFWFEAWGLDRHDPAVEVWRVEVRAGKKELKGKYQIRHFGDLEAGIGDVVVNTLHNIRYLSDRQSDSNVTRQALHPFWVAAQAVANRSLTEFRSGLVPGQIVEMERAQAQECYLNLVTANAVGYGVALGLSDQKIIDELPDMIAMQAMARIEEMPLRFSKAIARARERLHFIAEKQVI